MPSDRARDDHGDDGDDHQMIMVMMEPSLQGRIQRFSENVMHIFYYIGGKFGEVMGVCFTRKTLTRRPVFSS